MGRRADRTGRRLAGSGAEGADLQNFAFDDNNCCGVDARSGENDSGKESPVNKALERVLSLRVRGVTGEYGAGLLKSAEDGRGKTSRQQTKSSVKTRREKMQARQLHASRSFMAGIRRSKSAPAQPNLKRLGWKTMKKKRRWLRAEVKATGQLQRQPLSMRRNQNGNQQPSSSAARQHNRMHQQPKQQPQATGYSMDRSFLKQKPPHGNFFCSIVENINGILINNHTSQATSSSSSNILLALTTRPNNLLISRHSTKRTNNPSKGIHRGRKKKKRKGRTNVLSEDLLASCEDSYVNELLRSSPDGKMTSMANRSKQECKDGGTYQQPEMITAWSPLRMPETPQTPRIPQRPSVEDLDCARENIDPAETTNSLHSSPLKRRLLKMEGVTSRTSRSIPKSKLSELSESPPPRTPQPRRRTPRPISSTKAKKKKKIKPPKINKKIQFKETTSQDKGLPPPPPAPEANSLRSVALPLGAKSRRSPRKNNKNIENKNKQDYELSEEKSVEVENNDNEHEMKVAAPTFPVSARQHYENFVKRIVSARNGKAKAQQRLEQRRKMDQRAATSSVISQIVRLANRSGGTKN